MEVGQVEARNAYSRRWKSLRVNMTTIFRLLECFKLKFSGSSSATTEPTKEKNEKLLWIYIQLHFHCESDYFHYSWLSVLVHLKCFETSNSIELEAAQRKKRERWKLCAAEQTAVWVNWFAWRIGLICDWRNLIWLRGRGESVSFQHQCLEKVGKRWSKIVKVS